MASLPFEDALKTAAQHFKEHHAPVVRIIGNQDSDGLAAVSLLIKAFEREKIKFVTSIVRQVNPALIEELKKEHYETLFFVDIGSACIPAIEQISGRTIYVLDHHHTEHPGKNIYHLNPFLYGIDGARDIAAAGIAYLFARALNEENKEEAYLAVIGALGDGQEEKGFTGLNQDILDSAVATGTVFIQQDLRIFGLQTKPLHKAIEYSTSPYIPNVTGNEKHAIRFLEEAGIKTYEHGKWRKLSDLDEGEIKRLIIAITTKRIGSDENDEIYGPVYLCMKEPEESLTRDLREYSTLLNCCARMRRSGLGIATCLGNARAKEQALELHTRYRRDIIEALNWFYEHKGKESVEEGKGYVIINAEDHINDQLMGTLCSLISRSNIYEDGTIIIGLAHGLDDTTKISARIAGINVHVLNMKNVLQTTLSKLGTTAGGHSFAAGATISQEQEQNFLVYIKENLQSLLIEVNAAQVHIRDA